MFRNSIQAVTVSGPVELAAGGVVAVSSITAPVGVSGITAPVGVSGITAPVNVRQAVDPLDSVTLAFTSARATRTAATTAQNPYSGILVTLAATSAVQPSVAVAVQVVNATKGINSGWQTVPFIAATGAANAFSPELIFPVPADVGDSIQVNYISNGPGGNLVTSIFGLAACPPLALRPDGRLRALGGLVANNAAGAAVVNLIPAPTNGSFLTLLKRLNVQTGIAAAAGNGFVNVQGTPYGGGNLNLLIAFSSPTAPGGAEADYGDGLLLQGAVTLAVASNMSVNNVHAVYDYVM